MRINYIKLHKCKRLPFIPGDTFEHTFVENTTMINGGNGTGKLNHSLHE